MVGRVASIQIHSLGGFLSPPDISQLTPYAHSPTKGPIVSLLGHCDSPASSVKSTLHTDPAQAPVVPAAQVTYSAHMPWALSVSGTVLGARAGNRTDKNFCPRGTDILERTEPWGLSRHCENSGSHRGGREPLEGVGQRRDRSARGFSRSALALW